MSGTDWDRVKEIFHEVRELEEGAREARIAALCADAPELAARVRALLDAEHAGEGLLDAPTLSRVDAGALVEGHAAGGPMEGSGSRIGPYKLLQVIGEGGFGVVYMAEQDEPIRRRVALKVVKPGMDTKQVIARFEAERQALAMMDHPNIARVFDAGTTPNGRPYFVMELVKGVPITDYCDEQKLDARERLSLFGDVCSAVHHAHQSGIIHRDLKPSNVMVTLHDGRPVPKVIDFGVAKATQQRLTETTLFTEYHQFIGTPTYMSPEQAAYEGLDVDARSDVYSLGVLLYELLTGTTPHDSGAMKRAAYFEVLRILKEEEPPKPSTRVHTMGKSSVALAERRGADPGGLQKLLRGDLDWIVMKALEKDRRRRYGSASELAADIARYFESRPIEARPPSRLYRARKFARRRRGPLAAAAVMALAVLGDVGYVGWQRSHMAAGPLAAATRVPGAALLMSSDEHECFYGAQPSPDGTRVAYTDWCDRGGIYVYDIQSGETTTLASDTYYESVVWSPDGTRIATGAWREGRLSPLVLSLRTASSQTPAALEDSFLAPHAWSPTGDWMAGVVFRAGSRSRSLAVVSLETGEEIVLAESARQDQESTLAFSPDGRFVTFSDIGGESEDLFVLDLETDERWSLVEGSGAESQVLWSPDGTTVVYQNGSGVWAVPVSRGRSVGERRLVRRDGHVAAAWTEHGYYYRVKNSMGRGRRIALDPETGRAAGAWSDFALPGADLMFVRMAWSPDGSTAAVAGCCDGQLHLTDGRTSTTIPLGADVTPSKLWWSSDGTEVQFSTAGQRQRDQSVRTVFGVDVASGFVRELFPPVPAGSISHAQVSPDGEHMVFVRRGTGLILAELGQTEGRILATRNEYGGFSTIYGQPLFSPDGSRVGYTRNRRGAGQSLWVVRAEGGDETLLATGGIITGLAWHPDGTRLAYLAWSEAEGQHLRVASLTDGRAYEIDGVTDFGESELLSWTPDGASLLIREAIGRNELWVTRDILGNRESTDQ